MFQKVKLHFSLLCAGTTIFILAAMSLIFLHISEKSLYKNQFISFQNDMNTIVSNLEQQSVISYEWLNKIENNGKYKIYLFINDIPFLFNGRNKDDSDLYKKAIEYYESNLKENNSERLNAYHSNHEEFMFSYQKESYYCSYGTILKNKSELNFIIFDSLTSLNNQIMQQRILFCFLIFLFSAIMFAFSFIFTGIILKPVENNQKQQAEFIAAVSHELRTPLAVILSSVSAYKKANEDIGTVKNEFLDVVFSEGKCMSRLIEDMLTLSRADRHTFTIHRQAQEINTIILNSAEAFEAAAKMKNIHLYVTLPDISSPICMVDQERIRQVLSILIDNALCYTPEGGFIHIFYTVTDKYVEILVEDNGAGIADDKKTRIFERFYRADPSRNKKEHFGLGLSIASEIVHSHSGKLYVRDTKGGGSTFVLRLPLSL